MKIELKSAIGFILSLVILLGGVISGMPCKYAWGQHLNRKQIRINLATKRLVLIEGGQWKVRYKVAGIGDPASTPTPQGSFKVLGKEKRHQSSITGLWMPWSLRFYEDYYIHEVPEDEAGEKTTTKYSLGCIRLKPKDAKKVYQWAPVGTEITIYKAQHVRTPESKKRFQLYKTGVRRQIFDSTAGNNVEIIPKAELKAYLRLPVYKNREQSAEARPCPIFCRLYRIIKKFLPL